jgi:hypothetical protein
MIRNLLAAFVSLSLLVTSALAADGDAARDTSAYERNSEPVATRPGSLPILYGTLAALQAYDGWCTVMAVRSGATEANPALAGAASQPTAMLAVKVGATSASIYAAEHLWREHRRMQAVATMIAVNGMMAVVAAHNASVMRGLK